MTTEEKTIDYATLSKDELFEALGQAYKAKDMKLMGKLSSLVAKAEAGEAKAAKEALQSALVEVTQETSREINKTIDKMIEAGKLDGAEGVWFAREFGVIEEVGINPSCRLIKSGRKASSGDSSAKSSYVAHPAKSAELLAQVGEHVMFAEDTERTIDKQAVTMPAGMTYNEAYAYSTNGGWRNSVRMALLKEAGVI